MELRKRIRYVAVVAFAAILLLPLSVSAGGQGEGTAASEERMTITWEGRIKSGEDTTYAMDIIEEKFNVDIVPNGLGANDGREKVDLMIATGEFPDVGNYWVDRWALYDDGIIRSFTFDTIKKNMPNYTRMLNQYPIGWLINKAPDVEDSHIAIMGLAANTEVCTWSIGFRKDWADNVGFDLPKWDEVKIPMDNIGRSFWYDEDIYLDDWEHLLELFKDGDPDGNGKDDTIPWTGSGTWWMWSVLTGAFELNRRDAGNWLQDGELVDWRISRNFKDFLITAQRWWAKGLIDKEYATQDLRKAWEKTGGSHPAAMMPAQTNYASRDDDNLNRPPVNLATLDDVANGVQLVISPGPTGPRGTRGESYYRQVTSMQGYQVYIGSQVDDRKLAKIMAILDWMYYGSDEDWVTMRYGKEGVHFDWVGEPFASQAKGRQPEDIPEGYPKQGSWFTGYPPVYTKTRCIYLFHEKYYDFLTNYLWTPKGDAIAMRKYKDDIFNETNLVEVNKRVGETLQTMTDEFETRAIIGEIDIEAEWDSYVQKWLNAGGREYLEELDKAPIVEELRKGNIVYKLD